MNKLSLSLDDLNVESFVTADTRDGLGTVQARSALTTQGYSSCDTDANQTCTYGNPCPSDAFATLDVVTCAQSQGTVCPGGDGTVAAATCARTGHCCTDQPTIDRTAFCCK